MTGPDTDTTGSRRHISLLTGRKLLGPWVLLCLGRFVMESQRLRVGLFLGITLLWPPRRKGWRRVDRRGGGGGGGFFGTVAALLLYASSTPIFLSLLLVFILCYVVSDFSYELREKFCFLVKWKQGGDWAGTHSPGSLWWIFWQVSFYTSSYLQLF